jgi:predicted DNA-binding WGR domain protein
MRRFEYKDAKSNKFWTIDLRGRSFWVTFGRIGSAGQTQVKEFADEAEARKEHDKLIREKTGKGYVEVAAGPPSAAAPTPAPAAPKAAAPPAPPAPAPVAPAAAERTFVHKEGTSHKFWAVSRQGADLTVRFGKVGSAGQTQLKRFPDEAKAVAEHDKLIREKLGKGYAEVAASSLPAPSATPAAPKKVTVRRDFRSELLALLAEPIDDATLRARLEELFDRERQQSGDWRLAGFFHLWGPTVYRRSPAVFGPFLREHLRARPTWVGRGGWGKEVAGLLADVEPGDDDELVRLLYAMKLEAGGFHGREKRWRADLLAAFRAPGAAPARVLARFNIANCDLDEATAQALYEAYPAARDFILRHLPYDCRPPREPWAPLRTRALAAGDEDFALALYARTAPAKRWHEDAVALAGQIADPERLVAELERRHPVDPEHAEPLDVAPGVEHLLRRRGRDVMPYALRHLRDLCGRWGRQPPRSLLDLASIRGWLELWGPLVRGLHDPRAWNREVATLLADSGRRDEEVFRRLLAIAGPSNEESPGRGGEEWHHPLTAENALALHERFPELLRGPFLPHLDVQALWGDRDFPKLAAQLLEHDEECVDHLASRLLTAHVWHWSGGRGVPPPVRALVEHYRRLAQADPKEFARRASSVLGRLRADAFGSGGAPAKKNPLARLLFAESDAAYLAAPEYLRDLLESPEPRTQELAVRVLARAGAAGLAAENVDLLKPMLLRPLGKRPCRLACAALANAAATPEAARAVHAKAREALDLSRSPAAREELVALLGRLLHRWPELRGPREARAVYEGVTP